MDKVQNKFNKIGLVFQLLGLLSWTAMPAAFILYFYLKSVRPTSPEGAMCVELCDHGYLFYVTPAESILFYGLLCGGGLGFLIFMILGGLFQKKNLFNPNRTEP